MDAVRVCGVAVPMGMSVWMGMVMRVRVGVRGLVSGSWWVGSRGRGREGVGEEVRAVRGERGGDGAGDAWFELGEVVVQEVLEEVGRRFLDLVVDGCRGDREEGDGEGSDPRGRLARVPEALGWVDERGTVHRQRRSDEGGEVVAVDVNGEGVLRRKKEVAVGPLAGKGDGRRKEGRVKDMGLKSGGERGRDGLEVVLMRVRVVRGVERVGLRNVGAAAAAVELVVSSAPIV